MVAWLGDPKSRRYYVSLGTALSRPSFRKKLARSAFAATWLSGRLEQSA